MIALLASPQDAAPGDLVSEETFLFLSRPELWVVWLLLVPGAIAFAWWAYGGLSRLEPKTRVVLAALRGTAILVLIVLLFQPAFERIRYTKVKSQVHVLVDDSASMQRRDTYAGTEERAALEAAAGRQDLEAHSRADLVRAVLAKPGGLLEVLGATYDLRLFRFVRKPLPIRDLDELTSRGPRTHIGDALDLHLGAAGAVNLDAVVLVSDGRSNSGLPPDEVGAKYRLADVPIFAIGVGDPHPPRNIRLIGPPGPKDALRREEVVFDVTLDPEGGLGGREVVVTMHGALEGQPMLPLATETAVLGEDHVPVKVRLYHAFADPGDWTLKFEVDEIADETSHEDNAAVRFLRVNDEKIRVLYVDDLPRWEYRYLKNALLRVDPSIEAQVYLFDASGTFVQEHSPHLPPLTDIPRTREELFEYHVVLLGDVPPTTLAPTEDAVNRWLQLLVEFVEFGGGVGVLYGDRAMPEQYRRTPLEDLLPVVLEREEDIAALGSTRAEPFLPRLENPGQPHDITLLRRDPARNRELFERGFQSFVVYYPVRQAKPGATVLLRHPTAGNRYGPRVLAATSYFPRGHTFFVATDEIWRWRDPYGDIYLDRFWRNVVRHLASGRLRRRDDRVDLRVGKVTVDAGDQVEVSLRVRDDEFQPTASGDYPVFLRSASGPPERRMLRAIPGELGGFEGAFTMDTPGTFSFLVFQNDNPSDRVLAREDVFVQIPDREMQNSSQDRAAMERIAANSKNGRYLFLADADRLAEELSGRRPYETEVDRSIRPAWDTLWALLLVLGLLAAEWILRKRARLV